MHGQSQWKREKKSSQSSLQGGRYHLQDDERRIKDVEPELCPMVHGHAEITAVLITAQLQPALRLSMTD